MMTPQRWRQIEELYHAARERGSAVLQNTDPDLRREVERLLAQDSGERILDRPAAELMEESTVAQSGLAGQTVSHYRIIEKVGGGGMGVVYRALDTRLDRFVALKFLWGEFARDPAALNRFRREARAASALNHPNICTIHDIGEQNGRSFIAMEYVPGKTLDALIPRSGMRLCELLKIAIQVAEGLSAAHAAGIIHRDLKPSNIMVLENGLVKILDFGLAKLPERRAVTEDEGTRTLQPQTEAGIVMGTPAYMSPEQAEGRKLDARSDIFSFGSVLYEMATGQRAFTGPSRLKIQAKLVNEDPAPPSQLAPVPRELEKVILRCLRKDPSRRYQSMADLKLGLEDLETEMGGKPMQPAPAVGWRSDSWLRWKAGSRVALAVAGIAAATAAAFIGVKVLQRPPEGAGLRTVKFTITPANLLRGGDNQTDTEVSVSRDGKHITYVEWQGGQLWIRDLDQEEAYPVPGATAVYQAFWSPDNQFIGYSQRRNCGPGDGCDLVKIPVQGGTPVVITRLQGRFRRAFWSADGETIVYCDTSGLYTVPARGGSPTRVIEHSHIEHPSILELPGRRRAFLFQTGTDKPPAHDVWVQVAGENEPRLVAHSASTNPYPAYSSGHIIYVDGDRDSEAIWAVPFSLATLQTTGKPFPIAQHGSSPVVSATGTLVYSDVPADKSQLAWVDRSGKSLTTIGEPQRLNNIALSPDGGRLAVVVLEGGPDLWVYDLSRGVKSRFTFDPAVEVLGAWSPSGDQITYLSNRNGHFDIFSKPASGNGNPILLAGAPPEVRSVSWSFDQRFLIYTTVSPETKTDLYYRERTKDGRLGDPAVLLQTPFNEAAAQFSPDGHFVVYVSDESGRNEVYVREFPSGRKWQVSTKGGVGPRWRRDGKEIFYVEQSRLTAVSVTMRPAFSPGAPAPLFEKRSLTSLYPRYDVSAGGERFVILDRPANEKPLSIHVVHNWFEEFRNRQPK